MSKQIPFQQVLDELADSSTAFPARHLPRFSDLAPAEVQAALKVWTQFSTARKQNLLSRLNEAYESDTKLSFDSFAQALLDDPDAQVRAQALRLLVDNADVRLLPRLLQLLERDTDSVVRVAVARILGNFVERGELEEFPAAQARQVEDALLRVARADIPEVQRIAVEALGYSSRPEAIEEIQAAYHRHDPQWVATALFAMGRSADERWTDSILEQLGSSHALLRRRAAEAAGQLVLQEARQPLLAMLEEEDDDEVLVALIWSLSQIGGEDVRDTLEVLLDKTEDEELIAYLEEALENLDFTEDLERLDLLAFDPDDELPQAKKKKK